MGLGPSQPAEEDPDVVRLKELFASLDTENTGRITPKQLHGLFVAVPGFTEASAAMLMKRHQDSSGNSSWTIDEFSLCFLRAIKLFR